MLSIVIPAKNEEKNIGRLIDSIEKVVSKFRIKSEIIAVNDGSSDKTENVIKKYMKKYNNVKIVSYQKNRGKTYACTRGVKVARGSWIVIMDADLQHDPKDIPKFVKAMKSADLVVGERNIKKIPFIRRISNILASKVFNLFTSRNFDDVLCGYRAIKKEKYLELGLKEGRYELEIQMLLGAIKSNMIIKRIRVRTLYEKKGKKIGSRMSILSALKLVVFMLRRFWWFLCTNK